MLVKMLMKSSIALAVGVCILLSGLAAGTVRADMSGDCGDGSGGGCCGQKVIADGKTFTCCLLQLNADGQDVLLKLRRFGHLNGADEEDCFISFHRPAWLTGKDQS